jgi:Family of unknown function (DUF5991)
MAPNPESPIMEQDHAAERVVVPCPGTSCPRVANGDKLDITFVSFKDGGMNNQFGKKIYTANQPLFTLTKQGNAIATTWQATARTMSTRPVRRPSAGRPPRVSRATP